jgi:16S rRNA (uracil1498-N3)-methyltransferase
VSIFYTPYIQSPRFILDEQESRHAIKVLRLQVGDKIRLIDGKGGLFLGLIEQAHPKHCEIRVLEQLEQQERSFHLHIAIAPTKNMDRIEFFVEKATEIGIDRITPLLCSHSERKIIKKERLIKVAIAAAKQSVKARIPQIDDIVTFDAFIKTNKSELCFIAHCEEEKKIQLKTAYTVAQNALILIGPEGDFSHPEIELASQHGFQAVALGNERLRTETAGLVACHTINLLNQ